MKISFIGSGATSTTTAFAIGLKNNIDEIVLLDININIAKGKAIDLQQGFIMQEKNTKVIGTDDYKNVKGSDVIIITAGVARMPDGSRESLLAKNKLIITDIASKLKDIIPSGEKQPLIIVLTNPLDIILNTFIKAGNFNKKKTIGSGNWLDTSRFKYYLSKFLNVDSKLINTFAVGQHGAKIVYLLSKTTIGDKNLFDYIAEKNINKEEIFNVCQQATAGGIEIINLTNGGTIFGPAMSLNALFEAYTEKTKDNTLVASVFCNGEYGVNGFCFGCPVKIDKNGLKEIIEYKNLTEEENLKIEETKKFIEELNNK